MQAPKYMYQNGKNMEGKIFSKLHSYQHTVVTHKCIGPAQDVVPLTHEAQSGPSFQNRSTATRLKLVQGLI